MAVRNLEQQVEYLTKELTKLKQQLGGALPDPIAGPQGDPGPQGDTGPQGPRGPGMFGCTAVLPSPTAYKEGDFYQLFNGNQYKKINGSWVLQTSLRGPQGVVGPAGGTEVIANPVTVATDDLEKLTVDGTTYNAYGGWAAALNNYIYFEEGTPDSIVCDLQFVVDNSSRINQNLNVGGNFGVEGFAHFDDNVEFGNKASFNGIDRIVDSDDNPLIICENLKDANGHNRFIEGNVTINNNYISNSEVPYAAWSLSGTHLQIVLCLLCSSGISAEGKNLANISDIPDYIMNKIVPMKNNVSHICVSPVTYGFVPENLVKTSGGIEIYIQKDSDLNVLSLIGLTGFVESDKYYRIQFDLLIDMA